MATEPAGPQKPGLARAVQVQVQVQVRIPVRAHVQQAGPLGVWVAEPQQP
jgi:hypothetical protein